MVVTERRHGYLATSAAQLTRLLQKERLDKVLGKGLHITGFEFWIDLKSIRYTSYETINGGGGY